MPMIVSNSGDRNKQGEIGNEKFIPPSRGLESSLKAIFQRDDGLGDHLVHT